VAGTLPPDSLPRLDEEVPHVPEQGEVRRDRAHSLIGVIHFTLDAAVPYDGPDLFQETVIQFLFHVCDAVRVSSRHPFLQKPDDLKGFIPLALAPEPLNFPDGIEPEGLPVNVRCQS